jgi:hypothetical protein
VHDIWRAGAPNIDILAPDLYLEYFDEVCERFTRNGNPLFIPETSANPVHAINAFVHWNAIGYSPFYIERNVGPDTSLAAAYRLITSMAPAIAAQQGKDRMVAVQSLPVKVSIGDYTLNLTGMGAGRIPIAPEPTPAAQPGGRATPQAQTPPQGGRGQAAQGAPQGGRGQQQVAGGLDVAIFIAAGPNEFYMSGGNGNIRVAFTPNTPGPPIVGLGDVQEGKFVDGKWVVIRQLGGDDTGQGELLTLRPNTLMRVTVYRYE